MSAALSPAVRLLSWRNQGGSRFGAKAGIPTMTSFVVILNSSWPLVTGVLTLIFICLTLVESPGARFALAPTNQTDVPSA